MKQLKLSCLLSGMILFCIVNNAKSQIAKGTSLVGGSLSFSTGKTEGSNGATTDKSTSFTIMPSYGYAIKKNIIVGGDLEFGLYNRNLSDARLGNHELKTTSYGLGAFARHYRNLGNSGFYLFVQGRLGGNVEEDNYSYEHPNSNPDKKDNAYSIRLNVYPGISYAVTPKFHFETGLTNLLWAEYKGTKSTIYESRGEVVNKGHHFSVGSSLGSTIQWSIGFRFLWGS